MIQVGEIHDTVDTIVRDGEEATVILTMIAPVIEGALEVAGLGAVGVEEFTMTVKVAETEETDIEARHQDLGEVDPGALSDMAHGET